MQFTSSTNLFLYVGANVAPADILSARGNNFPKMKPETVRGPPLNVS